MSDYELQFQAELERAQALSLESLALDQYRRQRSYSQGGHEGTMSDYELQFQAELERAQALSFKTLTLDQYRRQRSYLQDPATPAPLLEEDGPVTLRRRRDGVESEPPPALPPPPRRAPRVQRTALADQQPLAVPSAVRSNHTSPTRQNQDLISFTSPKPNDAHASLKEYIDQIHKLGQKTEEMSINPQNNSNTPTTNTPFHNQIPGYYYAQPYNQQYPFGGYPPAPYPAAAPYGMPSPMPMQHYPYYGPPRPMTPEQNAASRPNSSPYVAAIPYSQTRMSSPAAYMGYPPPRMPQPQPQPQNQYDFTTTNLILRATRPGPLPATSPSIYPQLAHVPSYLPRAPAPLAVTGAMTVPQPTPFPNYTTPMAASPVAVAVAPDESNSLRPDFSRKLSEASATSNESNDTVGSLPKSLNLIDFNGHNGASGPGSVRVSVLEAFDPLVIDKDNAEYMGTSECGSSVYEEFDPLDFLYGEAAGGRETVCVAGGRRDTIAALPSPPPKSLPTVPAVAMHTNTTNKLYDCIVQTRTRNFDVEHKGFLKMVLDVRKLFKYDDSKTNPGHVVAARSGGKYPPNTSIKILVHHPHSEEPITFTSDVESTVEHMIMHVVCSLGEEIRDDMSQFMLRVWGVNEYLTPGSSLSEYDYIRQCVRLEKDVRLCLMRGRDDSLARSERDDTRDAHLTLDELLPGQGAAPVLSFENLSILLETLEGELSRAVGVVGAEGACAPNAAVQAVKAICALVGCLETLHLTHTLNAFVQACGSQGSTNAVRPEIVSERGDYCAVSLRSATPREALAQQCARLRDALRALLQLYARSQPLHFQLADTHFLQPSDPDKAVPAHAVSESTLFCIEAVHRLPPGWKHDDYVFHAQIYHGTRPLRAPHVTQTYSVEYSGFYPRIVFDTWLNLEETAVCTLPRESRLVLTLYGRTARAADAPAPDNQDAREDGGDVTLEQEELGWAAIQLFSYDGMLISGNYILPIWSTCTDKRLGPAPHPTHAPSQQHASVNIEVPLYERSGVRWSAGSEQDAAQRLRREQLPAFESLDAHTQSQLIHLIEQGAYQRMPPDCREILWEKRQYLVQIPGALPLVLLAATNWYGAHRTQLMSLLDYWEMPSALNAIHLLLPCFPDSGVRELAARAISGMSDDAMTAVLPQLVQALRHETYHDSALARTLLRRALRSPPIAHRLYWLLVHSLPGATPQNSSEEFLGISLEEGARVAGGAEGAEGGGGAIVAWRWAHRYQLLLRALLATAGENLSHSLLQQKQLVKVLSEVAQSVKAAKEAVRQRALVSGMEQLCALLLRESKIALPLSLSQEVHGVDVKSCTYFNSNTLPLKINFIGTDNAIVPAMFKVGDDLRQDALVLQVMRVMDSLWLKEGLDLRMVSFQAIPTQDRKGMIEIVSEAETLRVIQTEFGLTGSFKDRPIAEWLAKHNPSELEYERARDNFTASCAGYSVATYLLGICDRHNDNIMLKTSGHLFHIDFGKFLGDAQMFGNFKRDRAPFVLTSDMAYVINGGERPSQRFHYFVELCCMAFNIVRAHHDHILDLFALMATSGVPGVTMGAVSYVRGALLPGATQAEAAAAFARLIHSSLKSKFTPINFFLHNLAQLRASGDQSSPSSELLSFMPRTYTMASEGRLLSVEVLGYEKRYDPEKHYVYSLRIYRQGQATPSVLYRSYKHFTELYQKICLHFPLAKVHSLPMGLHVGRSNTRQVAERRFSDVQAFLTSLFELADEIAHSDLVYTFFHPLLRDQQDAAPQRLKHKVSESQQVESSGSGSIKISVQYTASVLSVLILHAQSLALTPQGLPPNPYVKVYLVPDPTKETKRKTRVLKRNSHPSFMEMLEYRMPIDVVRSRTLQATVWHYDSLQENQFLGGVLVPLHSLPLRQETVGWYPLEYIPR